MNFREPLPGESPQAFAAFQEYCQLGRARSIRKAFRKKTKKSGEADGTWNRWSATFRWKDRAQAYDARLDEVQRKAQEKAYAELGRKRADAAVEVHSALLEEFRQTRPILAKFRELPVADTVEKKDDKIKRIKGINGGAYARLEKIVIELARALVNGLQPTDKKQEPDEAVVTMDPQRLTAEEFETAEALARKMAGQA